MTQTQTPNEARAEARTEPTHARIRGILRRVARLDGDYSANADLFRDLGVRSIVALDLLLSIEEEFGLSITDEAFGAARTVSELAALVERTR
jgi:acyl carrier protein